MKKPAIEYICVLNQVYSISLDELDEETAGVCDTDLKTITIANDLSEDQMKHTMMHELLHAYMHESGVTQVINEDAEELIAQSLSGFLNGILKWTIKSDTDKQRH